MPGLEKNKDVPMVSLPLALPCPAAGSANPSSSLASLWNYMLPALEHIMRTPQETGKASVIDNQYHVFIHTAIYNYFLAQNQKQSSAQGGPISAYDRVAAPPSGLELWECLDLYFCEVARDILRNAPAEDGLAEYIVEHYELYSKSAQSVNRLLNYINRHFVKRSGDEDRGWLRVSDVMEGVMAGLHDLEAREKLVRKLRDCRAAELAKWGYVKGGTPEELAAAEASAEAASAVDRIVPIASLAYRRFRVDVLEPLLAVPKAKGGSKRRPPPASTSLSGPKGRLARSVKAVLESKSCDTQDKLRLASGLAACFSRTGVRPSHPLRQRVKTFLAKA